MLKILGTVIGFVLMLALLVLISTFFVKLAWDHSMTSLFNLREIRWSEAFFLSMLGNALTGGSRMSKED